MHKIISVPNNLIKPLIAYAPSSGATLPHPGFFPPEFNSLGIRQRNLPRNTYYGMVASNPPNHKNKRVFGFSYLDNDDSQTDEDLYVLDLVKKELEYFPKGKYEKKNSLYKGTHKGIKDYLLP